MSSSPYRAGFSLVELMVTVSIIGILATLAVPRFSAFIAQARRGEAKANLAHITTLQSIYFAEHYSYYYGPAMTRPQMIGHGGDCDDHATLDKGLNNYLGFAPQSCKELRYGYYLNRTTEEAFAYAPSDGNISGGKWLYPDCNGGPDVECGYGQGDVVKAGIKIGKPEVCRNITKYCPDGRANPVTPDPDPPTCNTSTHCCKSNTVEPQPTGLSCISWKGTYNSSAANKGCCQTNPPVVDPPVVKPVCSSCPCTDWALGTEPPATDTDNSKYVCYSTTVQRDRTDRRTCTKKPDGCVGAFPCPSTERNVGFSTVVTGTKPLDDSASKTEHECGCAGLPDPRTACRPPPTPEEPTTEEPVVEPPQGCDSSTKCCWDSDGSTTTPDVEMTQRQCDAWSNYKWRGFEGKEAGKGVGNGCCVCDATVTCCTENLMERNNIFGLSCDLWKGTYNSSAANKGCCQTTECNCTSTCPPTAPDSFNVADTYTCLNVSRKIDVNQTCNPANCGADKVEKECSYPGTKQADCDNLCQPYGDWGAWGTCVGDKEKRTRTRTCATNPCDTTSTCATEESQERDKVCVVEKEKPETEVDPPVVEPKCTATATICCKDNVAVTITDCPGSTWNSGECKCNPVPRCKASATICCRGNTEVTIDTSCTDWNSTTCACNEPEEPACTPANPCEKQACEDNTNSSWSDTDCDCTCSNDDNLGKSWTQTRNQPSGLIPSLINSVANLFGVVQCTTAESWDCRCTEADKKADCTGASASWEADTNNCNCNNESLEWAYDESTCSGECKAKVVVVEEQEETECVATEQTCCEGNTAIAEETVCNSLGSTSGWDDGRCKCNTPTYEWNFNGQVSCTGECKAPPVVDPDCTCTPDECPSVAPRSFNVANEFKCLKVTKETTVTNTCNPANCGAATVQKECEYDGTKEVTCDNVCPWKTTADSTAKCEAGTDGKWKWSATYGRSKSCENPCSDSTQMTDGQGNTQATCPPKKIERTECKCKKDSGDKEYGGKTVSDAFVHCRGVGGNPHIESIPGGTEVICSCQFEELPEAEEEEEEEEDNTTKYNLYIDCLTTYIDKFRGRTCTQIKDILEGSMSPTDKQKIIGILNILATDKNPDSSSPDYYRELICSRDTVNKIECGSSGATNCCALSVPN